MKRTPIFLLAAIVTAFLIVALRGLDGQALLYHDNGMNLLEAKFIDEGFKILLNRGSLDPGNPELWEKLKSETSGVPLHSGKPGFNLILWLASLFSGFHDTLSAHVTVVSGILCLILVFLIARQLRNDLSAVYAVTALASSTFYLVFCRAGLADQIVNFFFLSGIFLYLKFRNRSKPALFLVGLSFGYAFACNQWRVSYIIAILIGLETVSLWWEHWKWRELPGRLLLLATGFLTPIVLFQIPYLLLEKMTGSLPFPDYWAQLQERLTVGRGLGWFHDMGQMGYEYWIVEGGVFPTLVVLSWAFLIYRFFKMRRYEDLMLLSFSLVPFVYFSAMKTSISLGGFSLSRTTALIVPIAALSVGELLHALHQTVQKRSTFLLRHPALIVTSAAFLLMLQALPRHIKTGITRSGYRSASEYLANTGKSRFMILSMEPVWRFYLGRVAYEPYDRPADLKELVRRAEEAGIDHLIVDYSTIHSKHGMEYTASLIGEVEPLATFPNPRGTAFAYLLDNFGLEKSLQIASDPRSKKIYIFSIDDISHALKRNVI